MTTQTAPRIDKFATIRRQYDQAWVWSPGLADWFLVYDCCQAWDELNNLPAIGIKKPNPMPVAIERPPSQLVERQKTWATTKP